MNPILRMLLGPQASMMMMGDGRGDNSLADMNGLTEALKAARAAKQPNARVAAGFDEFNMTPNERVLKGHYAPPEPAPAPAPMPPIEASGLPAPASMGQGALSSPVVVQSTPMPTARPAEAPREMGFFERNTAMMTDPMTGDFIDPASAARAQSASGPDVIAKLMDYFHKKDPS